MLRCPAIPGSLPHPVLWTTWNRWLSQSMQSTNSHFPSSVRLLVVDQAVTSMLVISSSTIPPLAQFLVDDSAGQLRIRVLLHFRRAFRSNTRVEVIPGG